MEKRYWVIDPDGFFETDTEYVIRGEAGTRHDNRLVWGRKINKDGSPFGKPERMYFCDLHEITERVRVIK